MEESFSDLISGTITLFTWTDCRKPRKKKNNSQGRWSPKARVLLI
jgi:hypothetical protein